MAILPEYLVQLGSGSGERRDLPRPIDAYWILHVLRVHRGSGQRDGESAFSRINDDQWWPCTLQCHFQRVVVFRLNQYWHDDRWFWLDSMVQTVSIRVQPLYRTSRGECAWSKSSKFTRYDEWSRSWRSCIPQSIICRVWLEIAYLGLSIHLEASRDVHDDE